MLDEHEIRDLAQRYAVAASSRDVDAIAELFDEEVENGQWGPGRQGTRAYYTDFFAMQTGHSFMQVGTHQVDLVDAEHALGVAFTRSWSGTSEQGWRDVMVVYFDTYRKHNGRWGFVHRRETLYCIGETGGEIELPAPRTDDAQPRRGTIPRTWDYWERWEARKRDAGSTNRDV
jgi:ketosteroid isomerase-like protein